MSDEPVKMLDQICSSAQKICDVAKTAKRNGKSLKGDSFYGNRFHELTVEVIGIQNRVAPLLCSAGVTADRVLEFEKLLANLTSPQTGSSERNESLKRMQLLAHTTLKSAFEAPPAHPTPKSESVLPIAVVKGTRGYIENVVVQANACLRSQML